MSTLNDTKNIGFLKKTDMIVGIDLAMERFSCAVINGEGKRLNQFSLESNLLGFRRLIKICKEIKRKEGMERVIFSFEATGHFWENLAFFLEENNLSYRVVNPFTVKRFREGNSLNRVKNDFEDAFSVAELSRLGKSTKLFFMKNYIFL